MMPTVLQDGPYDFVFFSSDRGEPVNNHGFTAHELRVIKRLVVENMETLLEAWHDYFGI